MNRVLLERYNSVSGRVIKYYQRLFELNRNHRLLSLIEVDGNSFTRNPGFSESYPKQSERLDAGLDMLERYCVDLESACATQRSHKGAKRKSLEAA